MMKSLVIGIIALGGVTTTAWADETAPPCRYPAVTTATQTNAVQGTVILAGTPVCVLRVVTDNDTGGPVANANCPGEFLLAVRTVMVGPGFGVDGVQVDREALFCASQLKGK